MTLGFFPSSESSVVCFPCLPSGRVLARSYARLRPVLPVEAARRRLVGGRRRPHYPRHPAGRRHLLLVGPSRPRWRRRTLRDYFQLDIDLGEIVRRICEADPAAREAAIRWSGLRVVRQDPEECILSFVCSTANSVPRIAYSIGEFSRHFGDFIGEVRGQAYYTFPGARTLAEVDPTELSRLTSLGFRGRNLVRVAKQLAERGPGWAMSLRDLPYEQAHKELVLINGIGAKIADCVCLFSLDKTEAVPVDTHVWQLAKDLYFPDWPARKSLTAASYNTVACLPRPLRRPSRLRSELPLLRPLLQPLGRHQSAAK